MPAELVRVFPPAGLAGVTRHCSASRLRSLAMPVATVRTQYWVLGFRCPRVQGSASLLRSQDT